MSTLPDPVGEGLIASLARPGGNTTGVTLDAQELAGKMLDFLKEAVPNLSRVAILRNPTSSSWGWDGAQSQIEATARALTLEVQEFLVSRPEDLAPTFVAMRQAEMGAMLVRRDVLVVQRHVAEVVALAAQHRLPAMYYYRQFPDSGGLMSHGPNVSDIHRRSATFVDKILKGAKAGDPPVEQPMKFELVINLKTAEALWLTIPPTLLFQADEVIR
jgi:putative ABC transport system substrate-binding protein